MCASIQYTIVGILMDKLKLAVKETGINRIAIGGGVSANSGIRDALKEAESRHGWKTFVPAFEFTTDNAAMIAIVGHLKYLEIRITRIKPLWLRLDLNYNSNAIILQFRTGCVHKNF